MGGARRGLRRVPRSLTREQEAGASPAPHGHPTAGGWRSVPGASGSPIPTGRAATAHRGLGLVSLAWSPTEDQLAVVDGRDVTLVDTATGSETDLGTVVGARTARATRFMPWCGRPTDPGSRTEGDQVGARSTRSTWRPASTRCSCVSPRERGRSKTSTGRPMVHTSRSPTATRRASWRRRSTSRRPTGPTAAAWIRSRRAVGVWHPGLSVGPRGRLMAPDSSSRAARGRRSAPLGLDRLVDGSPHPWSRRSVACRVRRSLGSSEAC